MSSFSTLPDSKPVFERRFLSLPPIFSLSLAFSIGIWLADLVLFPFFLVALVTFFAWSILTLSTRRHFFIPLSLFVFFSLGLLFGTSDRSVSRRDIALSAPQGVLVLEGNVITVPETVRLGRKETISFVLDTDHFFRRGHLHPIQGKVQVFLHNPGRVIHFGDRLKLRGTLEVPKEKRNPHSFDYADYLARHGIRRIFRGIGRFSVVAQSEAKGHRLLVSLNRLRIHLNGRIEKLFPSPYYELASALILGFRKNMARDIQDAFIKTGTAHLIAISGLNISLIGGLFYFLLGFVRVPRSVNLGLTIAFVAAYVVIAGASIPVLRAGIMGIVILLGLLLGQDRNLKSAFFFAFLMLLVWDPSALFLASFQLSFVAMASLIFLLPKLEHALASQKGHGAAPASFPSSGGTRRLRFFGWWEHFSRSVFQTFLTSLAATIGMFPILVCYFNLFPTIGLLVNVVAIPVCTIGIAFTLILLLLDLAFSPLAHGLAFFPLAFFRFELWFIDAFAKVPIGYFYLPRPPWYFLILYYGCLITWLVLMNRPVLSWIRSACLILMGIVTCIFLAGAPSPPIRFVFFDLGKREAAFVSFSNGANLLINAGRRFPSDQAYWILRPFFMASGIQKLDSVLLTEVDGGHAGGFQTLSHHVRFQKVWVPPGSRKTTAGDRYIGFGRFKRQWIHFTSRGGRLQFGSSPDIYVDVLAVSQAKILALRIADGESRMLYVLSADPQTFAALSQLARLDYDFVFLPHHEYGMSEDEKIFLKRLSPHFVVLNQRDRIAEFRTQLEAFWDSTILFLEESGAIEFYRSGGRWKCKTFLNPPPKSIPAR